MLNVHPLLKRTFACSVIDLLRESDYTTLSPTPRELVEKQKLFNKVCWEGDWTNLSPQVSGGNIQVWDQTVGCPECGMNLWYLPAHGQWTEWDKANEPPPNWWKDEVHGEANPYDPYVRLFNMLHPFQFSDCHDQGDEDADRD